MPPPNSNGPGLNVTTVISTTLEAILYGFSVLMFILTIWVLTRNKKKSELNVRDLIIATLLFVLSTIHICIDIDRMFSGFVRFSEPDTSRFLGDISQPTFVFKNAIYTLQTILGDGVVIFRAYVVWQSAYPIILPSILLGGVAATGIGSVFSASRAHPGNIELLERSGHWITAFFSSTLACNLIGTLTLAYRLWSLDSAVRSFRTDRKSPVRPILMVCIDSGILYSVSLISVLILLVRGSRAQLIVLDMISPIISISFYLIILRVALISSAQRQQSQLNNRTSQIPATPMIFTTGLGPETSSNHTRTNAHTNSHTSFTSRLGSRSDLQEYQLKPMNVKVVKTTKIDREDDYDDGGRSWSHSKV